MRSLPALFPALFPVFWARIFWPVFWAPVFWAILVALPVVVGPAPGTAAPWSSESTSEAKESGDFTTGKAAIEAGDYDRAVTLMTRVVAAEPGNADALNYLGYSHRKLGNFPESLSWYLKALAADPDHRGANEYLGELYLQMGEIDKARLQLSKLDTLCYFGCEEYDDLKEAIADYEAGRTGAGSGGRS